MKTPEKLKQKLDSIPEIALTKPKKLSNLEKIILSRNILRENVKNKIRFSKPIITINNQPLFYPQTINCHSG